MNIPFEIWNRYSSLIREYFVLRPYYERLGREIAELLELSLQKEKIKFASISYRAKDVGSMLRKATSGKYIDPLRQITDLAGVRIVCLYSTDIPHIDTRIRSLFKVVSTEDKVGNRTPEEFGYGAVHYIVSMNKADVGARYEDLLDYNCEIQVRTLLQDAWATISHHLVYKRENDVPARLKRQINSLSALLEAADTQFDQIRKDRVVYQREAGHLIKGPDGRLQQELNVDAIIVFLQWKYPKMMEAADELHVSSILERIDRDKYRNIEDINRALDKHWGRIESLLKKADNHVITAIDLVAMATGVEDWSAYD